MKRDRTRGLTVERSSLLCHQLCHLESWRGSLQPKLPVRAMSESDYKAAAVHVDVYD